MSTTPSSSTPGSTPSSAPPGPASRISTDWAAVIVAAVLVLLAVFGLLPSIPFLVK